MRRSSSFSTGRIDRIYRDPHDRDTRLFLYHADLSDSSSLINTLNRVRPDEVYNLGAQSHGAVSFEMPEFTADTVGMGTLRLLEAIRWADWPIRFYQAGSSEMPGKVAETPQREATPFRPRSPYAASKVFAHHMTVQYREAYGLLPATASCSTTSLRGGVRRSSRGRSPAGSPRSWRVESHSSTSGTLTLAATGGLRRNTSRRCG
jgi:GDPmannose 4,6-dehydratase